MANYSGYGVEASYRVDKRDQQIIEHRELVIKIARHMIARLPAQVELSDLVQAGTLGLMEALEGYNPEQGASFETYASIRIKGAMIDELRRGDWAPRSAHRFEREMATCGQSLEFKLGRKPTHNELAQALGFTPEQLTRKQSDLQGTKLGSLDEMSGQGSLLSNHNSEADRELLLEKVADSIDKLVEREKLIVSLYYFDELNLKQIGEVLELSEGRVSQLLSKAISSIRDSLQ